MHSLRKEHKELTTYNGIGYCGYSAALLSEVLEHKHTDYEIILVRKFRHSEEGNLAALEMSKNILSFKDDVTVYKEWKEAFTAHEYLPNNVSHTVVRVGNTIYDTTSKQMGLPETYSFDYLRKVWLNIYRVNTPIPIGDPNINFGIDYDADVRVTRLLRRNNGN